MKNIILALAYRGGTCAEKDKQIELCIPALESVAMVHYETMVLIGVVLAMLTETFADHSCLESYQIASISIKISSGSSIRILYNQLCTIPCTGRDHLLWLNEVCSDIKDALSTFLFNIYLNPSDGKRQ